MNNNAPPFMMSLHVVRCRRSKFIHCFVLPLIIYCIWHKLWPIILHEYVACRMESSHVVEQILTNEEISDLHSILHNNAAMLVIPVFHFQSTHVNFMNVKFGFQDLLFNPWINDLWKRVNEKEIEWFHMRRMIWWRDDEVGRWKTDQSFVI